MAPSPPPAAPATGRVFLTARWHALAMLNYAVAPSLVEPLAPAGTTIDRHEGQVYVSLVGFRFLDTRVLGFPIPFHRHFDEVNLRFYVRRVAQGPAGCEVRRGVAFVREIVPRRAIAWTARRLYNEPYVARPMAHEVEGAARDFLEAKGRDGTALPASGPSRAAYRWKADGTWHGLHVRSDGPAAPLVPGSHAEFIAEHYFGYTAQPDGGTLEYRVEHPPWRTWQAREARFEGDPAATYGEAFAAVLRSPPATALLADGSGVRVFRPCRIPTP